MEYDLSRLNGIFVPEKINTPINIIGAGATGSFVAMELARIGCKVINIYDMDDVGTHNVSNQFFTQSDIGQQKVDALKGHLLEINPNIVVNAYNQWVEKEDIAKMSGYVFMLIDSMKGRKELFEAVKENKDIKYYWESRLGSDQARVYNIAMNRAEYDKYEMDFYDDDEAEISPCGTSITILPIVMMTASVMVYQFMDTVMERVAERPFKLIYDKDLNKYEESWEVKKKPIVDITPVVEEDLF